MEGVHIVDSIKKHRMSWKLNEETIISTPVASWRSSQISNHQKNSLFQTIASNLGEGHEEISRAISTFSGILCFQEKNEKEREREKHNEWC